LLTNPNNRDPELHNPREEESYSYFTLNTIFGFLIIILSVPFLQLFNLNFFIKLNPELHSQQESMHYLITLEPTASLQVNKMRQKPPSLS